MDRHANTRATSHGVASGHETRRAGASLRERLDALGPAPRAEFWSYPQSRAFAELLIDCEEDPMLKAVLVGMLREAERSGPS
jgi:hypothetical protein